MFLLLLFSLVSAKGPKFVLSTPSTLWTRFSCQRVCFALREMEVICPVNIVNSQIHKRYQTL